MARSLKLFPTCRTLILIVSSFALVVESLSPLPAHAQFGGLLSGGQEQGGGTGLFGEAPSESPYPQRSKPHADPPSESQSAEENAQALPKQISASDELGSGVELQQVLERLLRESSTKDAPFSPADLLTTVGGDPAALHAWIRNNVLIVPYRGELRGPEGVLRDRRGNSADIALLVEATLNAANTETRLVRSELHEDALEHLMKQGSRIPRDFLFPLPPRQGSQREGHYWLSQQRLQTQGERILSALDDLRPTAYTLTVWQRDRAIEAMREHWHIQIAANNRWIDIDPTFELFDKTWEEDLVEARPEHNWVTLRLVADTKTQDRVVQLEVVLPASEIAGHTLFLSHVPGWEDPTLDDQMERASHWLPVLSVGSDKIVGSPFVAGRGVLPPTDENLQPYISEPAKVLRDEAIAKPLDALGGGLLGRVKAPEPAPMAPLDFSFVKAQWLEIEIKSPGRDPKLIERHFFGPDMEPKSTDPIESWKNSVLLNVETSALMPRALYRRATPRLSMMLDVSQADANVPLEGGTISDVASTLFDRFSVERWALNQYSAATFIDTPNIFAIHVSEGDSERETPVIQRFDIIENSVGVQTTSALDPFALRVYQGVSDTVAEALVVGEPWATGNVSAVHAVALDRGVSLVSLTEPAEIDGIPNLNASQRKRLKAEVESRNAVLLFSPAIDEAEADSRWRVDLETGTTIGLVDQYGQGPSATAAASGIGGSQGSQPVLARAIAAARLAGQQAILRGRYLSQSGGASEYLVLAAAVTVGATYVGSQMKDFIEDGLCFVGTAICEIAELSGGALGMSDSPALFEGTDPNATSTNSLNAPFAIPGPITSPDARNDLRKGIDALLCGDPSGPGLIRDAYNRSLIQLPVSNLEADIIAACSAFAKAYQCPTAAFAAAGTASADDLLAGGHRFRPIDPPSSPQRPDISDAGSSPTRALDNVTHMAGEPGTFSSLRNIDVRRPGGVKALASRIHGARGSGSGQAVVVVEVRVNGQVEYWIARNSGSRSWSADQRKILDQLEADSANGATRVRRVGSFGDQYVHAEKNVQILYEELRRAGNQVEVDRWGISWGNSAKPFRDRPCNTQDCWDVVTKLGGTVEDLGGRPIVRDACRF